MDEQERIKALECENREVRQANESADRGHRHGGVTQTNRSSGNPARFKPERTFLSGVLINDILSPKLVSDLREGTTFRVVNCLLCGPISAPPVRLQPCG
ncbi:hypothetical protein [Azospirillum rugosum]|uniref:Uncharacterized protein n=1 Tax=Azospirillum rugosum TaxID=416170 RepID=A0ABS4SLB4_9PROT|nr:hypothetical protein [Azospirillum rugosum]MBP2293355.1 hypothetical protein [Azospirillum rugosum]